MAAIFLAGGGVAESAAWTGMAAAAAMPAITTHISRAWHSAAEPPTNARQRRSQILAGGGARNERNHRKNKNNIGDGSPGGAAEKFARVRHRGSVAPAGAHI